MIKFNDDQSNRVLLSVIISYRIGLHGDIILKLNTKNENDEIYLNYYDIETRNKDIDNLDKIFENLSNIGGK